MNEGQNHTKKAELNEEFVLKSKLMWEKTALQMCVKEALEFRLNVDLDFVLN